ncbi:hypothetical protein SEA_AMORE2_90 [Gordonia phage Amore2]|uniref:Uncharacterized protein n=2 Tax=Getseptimavirus TaxID=2560139 RepID=A0A0K0N6R1_9CAUD|nr:hypothetical protein GTE7_gp079 [Gordonia phage GTE7]YP_009189215.1 hypothetical protein AU104_gp040 [Gordonia phage GMA7]AER26622.1 hypothetical protein [Gordonia phage GTE7]AKJ72515.1 hypothetical protein GMA7_78 [Gordonia phage GMA7]USH44905.1 hypothetical protein SEA_AMORE2_90 [Gordonia phage Amore2]
MKERSDYDDDADNFATCDRVAVVMLGTDASGQTLFYATDMELKGSEVAVMFRALAKEDRK